jgi:NADP-dependent aldehyde dehydrogenase
MTETTSAQLESALAGVASVASAFAESPLAERAGMLRALADRVERSADDLVPIAQSESHLQAERLTGEVARTTGQLRFLADVLLDGVWLGAAIDTADPEAPALRPDVRSVRVGLGPVLVFAASNFPFAFSAAGGDTASALAAGCPVLLKTHPGHPELSARVGAIVQEVFGPAFALIDGVDAGRRAVADPRVKVAAFTGSAVAGRALFDLAAGRDDPIPFYGELGSVNPAFVSPGAAAARPAQIAAGFVGSFTLGVGQFCTKPGLLFAPAGSKLLGETVSSAAGVAGGPVLGDWVQQGHAARLAELRGTSGVVVAQDGGGAAGDVQPSVLATTLARLLEAPTTWSKSVSVQPRSWSSTTTSPTCLPLPVRSADRSRPASMQSPTKPTPCCRWPLRSKPSPGASCGTDGPRASESPGPCSTGARGRPAHFPGTLGRRRQHPAVRSAARVSERARRLPADRAARSQRTRHSAAHRRRNHHQ